LNLFNRKERKDLRKVPIGFLLIFDIVIFIEFFINID